MRARIAVPLVVAAAGAAAMVHHWSRTGLPGFLPGADGPDGSLPAVPPGRGGSVLLPGAAIELRLHSAPSPVYAPDIAFDAADETYAALVAARSEARIRYDPVLSRAARELAVQSAVIGQAQPPPELLTFVLRSAGAPEMAAALYRLSTTSGEDAALGDALDGALAAREGQRLLWVGMGEADSPLDQLGRHIVVLLSERDYDVDTTARRVERSTRWTVRGRLPPGFKDVRASVLSPAELRTEPIDLDGDRFALTLAVGSRSGELSVSIDGDGPAGPSKIMQLLVHVGEALPRSLYGVVPQSEPSFNSAEEAEQHAFDRLAEDRLALGLPAVALDLELSRIARAHSEEMRDLGTFGHRSERTGLAGDRLARAGYRSVSHAENLARNSTLAEAQRSLMESVSHRANIVNPDFLRVGIGVARQSEQPAVWYVTQLFSVPVVDVDTGETVARLLQRLERAAGEDARLSIDGELAEVAEEGAAVAAVGGTEGLAERLADDVSGIVGRISVSVQVVFGVEQIELPAPALSPGVRGIGIGVAQNGGDLHGRIGVVIIVLH